MRPVLLEMDGFASFRQRTTVDFQDVDYFALVGATGAGKSTVIDAIAFALYGSVARWDDARAVEPALAPSVSRGTVRLIFEARNARYQVMRELRRNANGRVQQKQARLERLIDPSSLGGLDDDIELLAGSIADTAVEVERLLGLDFNQFTKCVALPQGEFAEFLHAKPADRDKILTKLLGLDIYLSLGRTAGARGARLTTQADTLQATLDRDSGACSDEALAAARSKHETLIDLTARTEADVAAVTELEVQLAAATTTLTEHAEALALLDALTPPDGLGSLDADVTAAQTGLAQAIAAATDAEQADTIARDALRTHPPRALLERLDGQYTEQERLTVQAPMVAQRAADTAEAQQHASAARDAASSALQSVQATEVSAAKAAADTAGELERQRAQLALLDVVQAPEDLDELLNQLTGASAQTDASATALEAARAAHVQALSLTHELASTVTLDRAETAVAAAASALTGARAALSTLGTAHAQARADADEATHARTALLAAEAAAEAATARTVAADLRAHLTAGQDCPVCEQPVHSVPAPLDTRAAAAAAGAVTTARATTGKAENNVARSETQLAAAVTGLTFAADTLNRTLTAAAASLAVLPTSSRPELPNAPQLGELDDVTVASDAAMLAALSRTARAALDDLDNPLNAAADQLKILQQQRTEADEAVTAAAKAQTSAETAARDALKAQAALAEQSKAARVALRTARDPLVALGAPALDDSDLRGAWNALTAWAAGARSRQQAVVAEARKAADEAQAAHQSTCMELSAAQQQLTAVSAAYETAVREHEQALAAQRTHAERQTVLQDALNEAPAPEVVATQLAALAQLEAAADKAAAVVEEARQARELAAQAVQNLDEKRRQARADLLTARDPLVTLGAPPLPDDVPLTAAWTRLTDWAAKARENKATEHQAAANAQQNIASTLSTAEQNLRSMLTDAGVDAADPRPARLWATASVAGAREAASAVVRDIQAAQARSASTQEQIQSARAQAHVAADLARLLAINGFPRWLSKSALEVLVTAASATLMELSGGQFELALADNDAASFTVIDHTDADAERPVKTLSGGETFQASLSLALALSTHLGALASNGAAQLDAIFIDEGFGTLDENTLDTVATTLETLATSAGRMVGLITHVPALAARVPVRFAVQRDPRGSSIQRITA